jgi:hypothetical protein
MKTTGVGTFLALTIAVGLLTVFIAAAQNADQGEVRMPAVHQKQLAEDQLKEAIQLYKRAVHREFSSERVAWLDSSAPLTLYGNDTEFHVRTDESPVGKSILAVLTRKDGTNQLALASIAEGSVHVLKILSWADPQTLNGLTDHGVPSWLYCMLHPRWCKN